MKTHEEHKFKPTKDNWCPNYPNNQVRVSIFLNNYDASTDEIIHLVSVWGDDDCGMEKEFRGRDKEDEALKCYAKIMNLDYVDFKHVKELGFVGA
jgi:hypothetical protein